MNAHPASAEEKEIIIPSRPILSSFRMAAAVNCLVMEPATTSFWPDGPSTPAGKPAEILEEPANINKPLKDVAYFFITTSL
jgi:hypothetical protein